MFSSDSLDPSLPPQVANPLFTAASSTHQPRAQVQPINPASWLHWALVVALVIVTDVVLYQGSFGYSGWAVWLVLSAALLVIGILHSHRQPLTISTALLCATAVLTALRMSWQGNFGLAFFAICQLLLIALLAQGLPISMIVYVRFLWGLLPQAVRAILASTLSTTGVRLSHWRWAEFFLPAVLTGLFAAIFLMANPDAVTRFTASLSEFTNYCFKWIFSIGISQPLLWSVVALIGLGAIVPSWRKILPTISSPCAQQWSQQNTETIRAYRISRNTLVCVVGLFTLYLIVEFATMWFREFPEGFHYSGYAHAGAAWLTIALALSTAVMSAIFRPSSLDQSCYLRLMRWAKIWSVLNLLLALCVFNRLWIYISYNGMTRMRVVAILGVCCVIVGFSLVLIKAARRFSFPWLVEKQILALTVFLFLLTVLPVDFMVYSMNSRRVRHGDPAPAVQITEHRLSDSGYLAILPLLECDDPIIREGVAAMIAGRMAEAKSDTPWQGFQAATWRLETLASADYKEQVSPWLEDESARNNAIRRFKDHVWKWY